LSFVEAALGLLIHQRRYVAEILKRFDIENCNHAVTLAETRLQLSKNYDESDIDPSPNQIRIGVLTQMIENQL